MQLVFNLNDVIFEHKRKRKQSRKAHVRAECTKIATPARQWTPIGKIRNVARRAFRSTPPQSGSRLRLLHTAARLVDASRTAVLYYRYAKRKWDAKSETDRYHLNYAIPTTLYWTNYVYNVRNYVVHRNSTWPQENYFRLISDNLMLGKWPHTIIDDEAEINVIDIFMCIRK